MVVFAKQLMGVLLASLVLLLVLLGNASFFNIALYQDTSIVWIFQGTRTK